MWLGGSLQGIVSKGEPIELHIFLTRFVQNKVDSWKRSSDLLADYPLKHWTYFQSCTPPHFTKDAFISTFYQRRQNLCPSQFVLGAKIAF